MNQAEFLKAYDAYTTLPKKLRQDLLKQLKSLINIMVQNGDDIIFPMLGNIFVEAQAARKRFNPNTENVDLVPAHKVVKMARFSAQQQVLKPSWKVQHTFKKVSKYPSTSLAYQLRDWSGYDLLTCQLFLKIFVQIIIAQGKLNKKVVIAGIGTFKSQWIDIVNVDPVAPVFSLVTVAYSPTLKTYVYTGAVPGTWKIYYSKGNRVLKQAISIAGDGISAVAWSPLLRRFVAVGYKDEFFVYFNSVDGISWSRTQSGTLFGALCVVWNEAAGVFIAGGYSYGEGSIATSVDGFTWSMNNTTPLYEVYQISCADSSALTVLVGSDGFGYCVMYSSNLNTWLNGNHTRRASPFQVTWSKKLQLFISTLKQKSPNAQTWDLFTVDVAGTATAITSGGYSEKVAIAYGSGSNTYVKYSTDLITWSVAYAVVGRPISLLWSVPKLDIFIVNNTAGNAPSLTMSKGGLKWISSRLATEPKPIPDDRRVIVYRAAASLQEKAN